MTKDNSCFPRNQKLTSLKKALRIILKKAKTINNIEAINLENSEGRILAKNLISKINVPSYNNSAVDGFAFNFEDFKKNKGFLKKIGSSSPGKPFFKKIDSGESIEIFTGSYLISKTRKSADTVVMKEDCEVKGSKLKIMRLPQKGANIRLMGEDIKKGKIIMKKGSKIRPVDLGFISSIGINKFSVYKKIKVGIFSSGNELSTNNKTKQKYKIFDSNKITLFTLLEKLHCEVIDLGIIEDDYQESIKKLNYAASQVDLIITTGGVAGSESDLIVKAVNRIGELNLWKLAIKPGRPLAFGSIQGKPFFGLPGNPVSVQLLYAMLVKPLIEKLSGGNFKLPTSSKITANFSMKKKTKRMEWLRVNKETINNKNIANKFPKQGSGMISSISYSDGIIEIDENVSQVNKGDIFDFYSYESLF